MHKLLPVAILIVAIGCKKIEAVDPPVLNADTTLALKDAAPYDLGVGIDYANMKNNATYASLVKKHFDNVTFGYLMKHGAIVKDNGSFDYTNTDDLVNMVKTAGLGIYGHTLCWHQNNNGNYLRALVNAPSGTQAPNPSLMANGGFEAGSGSNFDNWGVWNGAASVSAGAASDEVYEGSRSLKATVAASGNPWDVQVVSDAISMTANTAYKVRFYAKAAGAGGKFRLSNKGGSDQYSGDYSPTTNWAPYEWTFTANDASKRIVFDMGAQANTYYIDSVSVTLANPGSAAPTFAEQQQRVDTALKQFITTSINRYKQTVRAWDVVNEPLDNNGLLRRDPVSVSDQFYWFYYLGEEGIKKAFQYARAADPAAILFLNEYGQESSVKKLDSLVALVSRLKAAGVPVDGVGLQMHTGVNEAQAGIDRALSKMARLGLKVKITELDVRLNTGGTANFVVTPAMLVQQASMYRFIISSYLRNVPESQRAGITVWGVGDADSWLIRPGINDAPLLWNVNYEPKPAFHNFQTGLQVK